MLSHDQGLRQKIENRAWYWYELGPDNKAIQWNRNLMSTILIACATSSQGQFWGDAASIASVLAHNGMFTGVVVDHGLKTGKFCSFMTKCFRSLIGYKVKLIEEMIGKKS